MPSNACVYWVTGLPAAGKTTLAHSLAHALEVRGRQAYVLDGDELRQRSCADLAFQQPIAARTSGARVK